MKRFLNTLDESTCILDDNKKLVYLNRAALEGLGYINHQMDVNLLEKRVEVSENHLYLHIKNNKGRWIKGVIQTQEVVIEEGNCLLGKIQWCNQLEARRKLDLLESFLDHMSQSVCIKDKEGIYVYANKHYRERIGVLRGEEFGKKDIDYWGAQYSEMFKETDDYTLDSNRECIIEEEVTEEEKYFETTKFPIKLDEAYIGILIKDITLQKILYKQLANTPPEADRLLKLNQTVNHLKDYFKTDNVNIWVYSERKGCVAPCFNRERIKNQIGCVELPITKKEVEEIKGRKEVVVRTNTVVFRGEKPEVDETKPIFYVIYYPIVYENQLVGVLDIILREEPKKFVLKNYFMHSICQHIAIILGTQNLWNQLQIESEQRLNIEGDYKNLIDIVTDLVIKVDEEGYFRKVNEGSRRILGWSEEEFLSIRWQDLIHPEDIQAVKGSGENYKTGDCQRPSISRYRCKDGSYKWLRWDGYYKEKEGAYLATAKDITHEMELEAKEKLAKEVLQIEKLRNEFFSNLSHELKTPLTIIMSALQMLETIISDELEVKTGSKKYIGTIKQNSYRLLRLVNNLIDTTKIDSGYYNMNIKNYNIVYVIEEIVMSVAEYANNQAIEIIFDTETEEEVIACDPDKIERIMLNLLSNAIKYTVEEGKVEVYVKVEGEEVLISVQDNGIGIPKEKVPYIFERFMQVNDVLTRHCEGSGIGLYLVRSLVELHEGNISVESIVGEGTRFEIRLPRVQREEGLVIESIEDSNENERRIKQCHIEFSDIYKI